MAKQAKRKTKEDRRALRKEQKAQDAASSVRPGVDPDLIGIVPGPHNRPVDL
jgi:hypothetical protein